MDQTETDWAEVDWSTWPCMCPDAYRENCTPVEYCPRCTLGPGAYGLFEQRREGRAEIARLRDELAKVRGYQLELAERCYRKDLELDELRHQ